MKIRAFAAPAACLLFAGVLAACENSNEPEPYPATIMECETNTGTVCGTWTLNESDEYDAVWAQGSGAVITIERFDADSAVFMRTDKPGTTSAGMVAMYRGRVQGSAVIDGRVTWSHNGITVSGSWNATW